MSFREFLDAVGENGLVRVIDKMDEKLLSIYKSKYVDWLKKYYYIGGMPEVVSNFIENKIGWKIYHCGLFLKYKKNIKLIKK